MSQPSILLLGNASPINPAVRTTLVERGFRVAGAWDWDVGDAVDLMYFSKFELALLNLDTPCNTSVRACREIREHSDMGIILLSASTAERDKIDALQAGADDYVTKPFEVPELLARIRAVLRRSSVPSDPKSGRIQLDDLEIDFETRRVRVRGRKERLTPMELDLLRYLLTRANKTVAHLELLQAVWGIEFESTDHCLRGCVARLRRKIEASPNQPKYLLTEPWVGYRLQLPK
jgi:two-component system KDP operon response regulator KdpE